MSLFSTQEFFCCMCGVKTARTCNDGAYWHKGVCSEICRIEKEWRYTLSVMNKPYSENPIHERIRRVACALGQCLLVFDRVYHAFDEQQCGAGCRKDAKWMDPSDFRYGGRYHPETEKRT